MRVTTSMSSDCTTVSPATLPLASANPVAYTCRFWPPSRFQDCAGTTTSHAPGPVFVTEETGEKAPDAPMRYSTLGTTASSGPLQSSVTAKATVTAPVVVVRTFGIVQAGTVGSTLSSG